MPGGGLFTCPARQEPVGKLQIITQNISRLLDARESLGMMRERGYVIGFKHCNDVFASSRCPSPLRAEHYLSLFLLAVCQNNVF